MFHTDTEFLQDIAKFERDLISLWKMKYNYSRSDERYKNATISDIYEDMYDEKMKWYSLRYDPSIKGIQEIIEMETIGEEKFIEKLTDESEQYFAKLMDMMNNKMQNKEGDSNE